MKKLLIILFFCSLGTLSFSNTDSLLQLLNKTKADTIRFDLLNQLARLSFSKDQQAAEKYSQQLFREADKSGNQRWIASAYTLLGNIKFSWADFDSSYFYFEKALIYWKKIKDSGKRAAITSNLGMILNEKGEYDEALKKFNQCIEIDKKNNDIEGLSGDYNNIGVSYWNKGEMQKAIDAYHKSIKYAEEAKNEHLRGQGLNNIGIIYRLVKNYKEALNYHKQSAEIFDKAGDVRNLASVYSNIGSIYEETFDFKSALIFQEMALKISLENNDKAGAAIRLNNLGVLYESMGDLAKSVDFHKQSLKIKEEIKDLTGISYSKANIGMLYNKLGKYDEAIKLCTESYQSSKKIISVETEMVACGCLYEAYKNQGKFKLALDFHEKERILEDSLSSNEQASELAKKETAFRYEKMAAEDSIRNLEEQKVKDAQIKARDEQIKREQEQLRAERLMKYSLYGGLFLVLCFAVIIYNRFKLTRKQKGIIEYQMQIVEEQNHEIRDSISYAKRIQDALLNDDIDKKLIPAHFIYYKPKDVISGDFYWSALKDEYWYVCVGDCTGHGVPGALLTMLGVSSLNELISLPERLSPDKMLYQLRNKFVKELSQSVNENSTRDGMDISLLSINLKTLEAEWAGANNPLWVLRAISAEEKIWTDYLARNKRSENIRIKNEQIEQIDLLEIGGDKQPIGFYLNMNDFTNHKIQLRKNDMVFLFSDGFSDQFGGDNSKKLKASNTKRLLVSYLDKEPNEYPVLLDQFFNDWKGNLEQVDDVCIIGIKI